MGHPKLFAPVIALGMPSVVIAYFYRTHIKCHSISYNHVHDFYWTRGSSRVDFILRNLRADLNYILPVEISSTNILLGILVVFVPLLAYFGCSESNLTNHSPSVSPVSSFFYCWSS
jgi:hypothetical protein